MTAIRMQKLVWGSVLIIAYRNNTLGIYTIIKMRCLFSLNKSKHAEFSQL